MREKLLIGSLIYATISASAARAQERPIGNKPLAEISYRPVGKLIYVPIQVIDGSGRLWFIFDTGAPNSIIDTAAAQTLHVKSTSSGIIHGAGKGDISADDVGEVPFTFGGLTTRVPHAKIVDLSKVPVPVRADGLLGAEFLEQYVIRIDPAARRSPAGCVKLPVIDALEARVTRRPAMKKLTTTMMQKTLSKLVGRLTVGLDLGDRSSFYCVLDGTGDVLLEQKVSTTPRAINEISRSDASEVVSQWRPERIRRG